MVADDGSYGTSQPPASVPSVLFYQEYFGHDVHLLEQCHEQLRSGSRACIFLAGDSSLDNKFWFNSATEAINGYERVLRPPRMKQDVCYWINAELVRRGLGTQHFCLNTAVEATSLNSRSCCTLLPASMPLALRGRAMLLWCAALIIIATRHSNLSLTGWVRKVPCLVAGVMMA